MVRFLEKWGHYFLAALCAGVILLSGLWTRAERGAETPGAQALNDLSARLADAATPPPETFTALRPCQGAVCCSFSRTPVYFPETGVWRTHPATCFAAETGEAVCAMAEGTVTQVSAEVRLDHGNGYVSVYRGVCPSVEAGQRVRAGQALGTASGGVLFEGQNRVCVALVCQGEYVPPGWNELTNNR